MPDRLIPAGARRPGPAALRRVLVCATLSVLAVAVTVASRNHPVPQPQGALSPPFPDLERTTDLYDPPVMAGRWFFALSSAGFYARLGDQVVLTNAGHGNREGTVATDPDGTGIRVWFSTAPPGMFDETTRVGGITLDVAGDIEAQLRSIADLLRRKKRDLDVQRDLGTLPEGSIWNPFTPADTGA